MSRHFGREESDDKASAAPRPPVALPPLSAPAPPAPPLRCGSSIPNTSPHLFQPLSTRLAVLLLQVGSSRSHVLRLLMAAGRGADSLVGCGVSCTGTDIDRIYRQIHTYDIDPPMPIKDQRSHVLSLHFHQQDKMASAAGAAAYGVAAGAGAAVRTPARAMMAVQAVERMTSSTSFSIMHWYD